MSALAVTADFAAVMDRLMASAARLGAARAKAQALARLRPDRAWRSPGLLWPLFTSGAD